MPTFDSPAWPSTQGIHRAARWAVCNSSAPPPPNSYYAHATSRSPKSKVAHYVFAFQFSLFTTQNHFSTHDFTDSFASRWGGYTNMSFFLQINADFSICPDHCKEMPRQYQAGFSALFRHLNIRLSETTRVLPSTATKPNQTPPPARGNTNRRRLHIRATPVHLLRRPKDSVLASLTPALAEADFAHT